ncbi:hypothetical protein [Bacillus suaedae]|uniref:Uncharacterized protein n=1 Tax=Halalkalibacter suaedae TaxID=2822140 RepID=A0A940WWA9_9BACI|nr:hypothetical protein [Bacillus suaedae]MBP3951682.1 hypothetical protein [Bacillus suaedae]
MFVVSIIVMLCGLTVIFIGNKVRVSGKTTFIAGNHVTFHPQNEQKLAIRIGILLMVLGLETLLFPLVFHLISGIEGYHFAVVVFLHVFVVFILMIFDQVGI